MPVAPGAFVGAAPEVRAVAVPMRAATALPISTVMVMALALALALTLAAALVVPALRERGRAWQARREQKQQNTLEHHFSVITTRLRIPIAVTWKVQIIPRPTPSL
jgi:hypothetical protein